MPRPRTACRTLAALLYALVATAGAGAEERQPNVLLLNAASPRQPAVVTLQEALRSTLAARAKGPVNFYAEHVDLAVLDEARFADQLRALLLHKYAGTRLDLVAVLHSKALRFAVHHRAALFSGAPIVFAGVDRSAASNVRLDADVTGVWVSRPWAATLDAALRLQPDTRRVVVVGGTSPADEAWLADAASALGPYRDRLDISQLTGLPLGEIMERVANLPPGTVVLAGAFIRDGAGVRFESSVEPVRRIAAAAAVPVYTVNDALLGTGVVGGLVVSWHAQGVKAGDLAAAVLRGERPAPVEAGTGTGLFDWRQLQRWGLDTARLPAGSEIRFREPSLWERYRWYLVGVAALLAVQTGLIAALLVQRAHRRRAQRGLAARLQFETLLSELSATFLALPAAAIPDHVTDALRRVVEALDLDRASLAEIDVDGVRVAHAFTRDGLDPLPSPGTDRAFPWVTAAVREGRVIRCATLAELPEAAATDRASLRALGIQSFVSMPLLMGGAVRGALSLSSVRAARAWPDDVVTRLRLLAEVFTNALAHVRAQAALAASHVQTRDLAARLITAQEEERRRIARELHDDLNQKLAALAIALSGVTRRLPPAEAARVTLRQIHERTAELADDVRRISHELHPAVLEHAGLAAALRAHCAELRHDTKLAIELDIPEPLEAVTLDAALSLYRIAQEALRNAVRHAGCQRAWVNCRTAPDVVSLTVADDGEGFDVAAAGRDHRGLGLRSMGERARLVGGTVDVRSTRGRGTVVTVRIPLPPRHPVLPAP
jgi:signal transduction histidine kinase